MQTQQKPPSTEQIRDFVIAGHGNLDRVKQMLAENPQLLNVSYQWNDNDRETAIQAAAQVGNTQVARYLLDNGAPLEICTAAMLGRRDAVEHLLKGDPLSASATGAHGIPLLPHAVWSGDLELVQLVYQYGAKSGSTLALHNAVAKGNYEIARWLLENAKPDIGSKNFQGKTPLMAADDRKDEKMAQLLRGYGAED